MRLTKPELEALNRELRGDGGFQQFGRKLRWQVKGSIIKLDDADLGRIIRHLVYGPGGFEERLRTAFGRNLIRIVLGRK